MDGKNTYECFWRGKRATIHADTSYQAQTRAAEQFKAKRGHEVAVVLAAKGEAPVLVHPASL